MQTAICFLAVIIPHNAASMLEVYRQSHSRVYTTFCCLAFLYVRDSMATQTEMWNRNVSVTSRRMSRTPNMILDSKDHTEMREHNDHAEMRKGNDHAEMREGGCLRQTLALQMASFR